MGSGDLPPNVAHYKTSIESLAKNWLDDYSGQLSKRKRPKTKEINDCIWGTIVLKPFEVLIVDSPLLQRLRGIRQLGVAHWTYPNTTHSRFEHSIGVLTQIQRIVDSIEQHSQDQQFRIPEPLVNTLRLAAVCHSHSGYVCKRATTSCHAHVRGRGKLVTCLE